MPIALPTVTFNRNPHPQIVHVEHSNHRHHTPSPIPYPAVYDSNIADILAKTARYQPNRRVIALRDKVSYVGSLSTLGPHGPSMLFPYALDRVADQVGQLFPGQEGG
jgi:hypothetical protein